jgi:glycosyltransferase involved in cell wall biosynthesis
MGGDMNKHEHIFINGRFLTQGITGVQRYARETLLCMDELLAEKKSICPNTTWTVLAPPNTPQPDLRHIDFLTVGRLQGHAWEQLDLAWHSRRGLLFSFGFTGPLLHANQIITVHDGAVVRIPDAYTTKFRLWYTFMVSKLVSRGPATIAVSEFSKKEAIACFGAASNRVHVVTEGWQHLHRIQADKSILEKHKLPVGKYMLAVSSATPNKNFGAIVQAMRILGADAPICVVAGASNNAVFKQSESNYKNMIKVGYVSDEELKALYQHAACFVFPSFYEGFGIPPMEAMSLGCPVIASTAEAVQEVCGDAALYFDPNQPKELAQRLKEFFTDSQLPIKLAQAGHSRASQFSWQHGAKLNLQVILNALNRGCIT